MGTLPKVVRIFLVAAVLVSLLGGCDLIFGIGTTTPTYVVSGTISGDYYVMYSSMEITVTNGSKSFSTSVDFSSSGSSGQEVAYSLVGVPAGTYSVSIVFTAPYYSDSPTYSIGGVEQESPAIAVSAVSAAQGSEVTYSVSGLTIGGSETIDVYLGDVG